MQGGVLEDVGRSVGRRGAELVQVNGGGETVLRQYYEKISYALRLEHLMDLTARVNNTP